MTDATTTEALDALRAAAEQTRQTAAWKIERLKAVPPEPAEELAAVRLESSPDHPNPGTVTVLVMARYGDRWQAWSRDDVPGLEFKTPIAWPALLSHLVVRGWYPFAARGYAATAEGEE